MKQDNRFTKNNKEDGKTMKYSDDWKEQIREDIIYNISVSGNINLEDDEAFDVIKAGIKDAIAKTEEHFKKDKDAWMQVVKDVEKLERKAFADTLEKIEKVMTRAKSKTGLYEIRMLIKELENDR